MIADALDPRGPGFETSPNPERWPHRAGKPASVSEGGVERASHGFWGGDENGIRTEFNGGTSFRLRCTTVNIASPVLRDT